MSDWTPKPDPFADPKSPESRLARALYEALGLQPREQWALAALQRHAAQSRLTELGLTLWRHQAYRDSGRSTWAVIRAVVTAHLAPPAARVAVVCPGSDPNTLGVENALREVRVHAGLLIPESSIARVVIVTHEVIQRAPGFPYVFREWEPVIEIPAPPTFLHAATTGEHGDVYLDGQWVSL